MSRFDARPSSESTPLRRIARRGTLVLVAGAGAAALLAGCGAGQISETAKVKPAVQGANADSSSGSIALRDLTVRDAGSSRKYPVHADAPLVVRIANSGGAADTLTSVTTTAAASVVYVNANASASPSTSASGSASASSTPSGKSSPTGSASPSTSSSATPGSASFQLTLGAGQSTALTLEGGQYLQLHDLRAALAPGQSVRLVFHFRRAGDIPVTVPLVGPDSVTDRTSAPAAAKHED